MEMQSKTIFDYIHYLYMIGLTVFFGVIFIKLQSAIRKLKKTQEQLKDAKEILEIKVQARTKELSELTERQEETIQIRTKELQNKVEELERFNKLAVGRELKMMELKKKLKEQKEE